MIRDLVADLRNGTVGCDSDYGIEGMSYDEKLEIMDKISDMDIIREFNPKDLAKVPNTWRELYKVVLDASIVG